MIDPVHQKLSSAITENNWNRGGKSKDRFEKDGYEIYFHSSKDEYELTIRDPETMQRETIVSFTPSNRQSPFALACLLYLLENAESVVAKCE